MAAARADRPVAEARLSPEPADPPEPGRRRTETREAPPVRTGGASQGACQAAELLLDAVEELLLDVVEELDDLLSELLDLLSEPLDDEEDELDEEVDDGLLLDEEPRLSFR